jgi:hypothetical protein
MIAGTIMRIMKKNRLMSGLTSVGLSTIFLVLMAFSIWTTLIIQQTASRTTISAYLNDQYQQARFAVGAEESLERKYRPEPRAAHTAATVVLVTALHNIDRRGDSHDQRVVAHILAIQQRYLTATHLLFTALAMELDHHAIDPVFSAMQQQVNTEAISAERIPCRLTAAL